MSDLPTLTGLADQMFGSTPRRATTTSAGRRRYRQATDSYLELAAANGDALARRELKRRYGNLTPAEFWAATK